MNEIFKSTSLLGFPDYEVSNLGQVRNVKTNLILSQRPSVNGYIMVSLHNNCHNQVFNVGRLVLLVFNPINDIEAKFLLVDHINRDRTDNRLENLLWVTAKENVRRRAKSRTPKNYHVKGFYLIHIDIIDDIERPTHFLYFDTMKKCPIPTITLTQMLKDNHYSNKHKCRAYYVEELPNAYQVLFNDTSKLW